MGSGQRQQLVKGGKSHLPGTSALSPPYPSAVPCKLEKLALPAGSGEGSQPVPSAKSPAIVRNQDHFSAFTCVRTAGACTPRPWISCLPGAKSRASSM